MQRSLAWATPPVKTATFAAIQRMEAEKASPEEEIEVDLLNEVDDDTVIRSFYLGGQTAIEEEVFSDAEESDEEHPTLKGRKYLRVKSARDVVKVMDRTIDRGETTVYTKYPKSNSMKTNYRLMHKTHRNPGNYLLFYAGTQDSPSYEDFEKLKGKDETEKEAFAHFQSFAQGTIPPSWTEEQQKKGFALMSISCGSEYERATLGLQAFQVESENIQAGRSTFEDSFTKGPNKSTASFLGAKKDGGSADLRRVERDELHGIDQNRKKRQADAIRLNVRSRSMKHIRKKFKGRRVGGKTQFSPQVTEALKQAAIELLKAEGKDVLCRLSVLKKK
ncbi:hypothetical protein [Silvibacterium sp.]|uniref:hypothetical protein n=1 Tax=Silvibacterium sp. TaxID=1964179 RepID=UPI0039E45176